MDNQSLPKGIDSLTGYIHNADSPSVPGSPGETSSTTTMPSSPIRKLPVSPKVL